MANRKAAGDAVTNVANDRWGVETLIYPTVGMSAIITIAANHIEPNRPWLEFGVAGGATLRQLAEYAPVIYGFDWWGGLPEDWLDPDGNLQDEQGTFRCDPPSNLPPNAFLVKGLFQDTLPKWLSEHPVKFGLVHIDCDLYSSTKFVLNQLEPYLDGAVLAFDEIVGFPAGEYHEGRAFAEFVNNSNYDVTFLGQQHRVGGIYKLCAK